MVRPEGFALPTFWFVEQPIRNQRFSTGHKRCARFLIVVSSQRLTPPRIRHTRTGEQRFYAGGGQKSRHSQVKKNSGPPVLWNGQVPGGPVWLPPPRLLASPLPCRYEILQSWDAFKFRPVG